MHSSVDAPRDASGFFEKHWHVVGCCHLSGLWCSDGAAGLYGSSQTGTRSLTRALGTVSPTGSSSPVSPTVAPYAPSTDYTSDDLRPAKITPWLRPEPCNSPASQGAPRR